MNTPPPPKGPNRQASPKTKWLGTGFTVPKVLCVSTPYHVHDKGPSFWDSLNIPSVFRIRPVNLTCSSHVQVPLSDHNLSLGTNFGGVLQKQQVQILFRGTLKK